MTAPGFVPIAHGDRPRKGKVIPPAKAWTATRPGDVTGRQPTGVGRGRPGPDQGYAMALANRYGDRLVLAAGEGLADVTAGCVAVAMRRASLFGRGPVVYDLELAFGLFGYLGQAPDSLVAFRRPLFAGAAHHYDDQRTIADCVAESTLRLSPDQVKARSSSWNTLLNQ